MSSLPLSSSSSVSSSVSSSSSSIQYSSEELRQRNARVHAQFEKVGGCSKAHSAWYEITGHSDINPTRFAKIYFGHVDSQIWKVLLAGRNCAKYDKGTEKLAALLSDLRDNEDCSPETFKKVLAELTLMANKYEPKNEGLLKLLEEESAVEEESESEDSEPDDLPALESVSNALLVAGPVVGALSGILTRADRLGSTRDTGFIWGKSSEACKTAFEGTSLAPVNGFKQALIKGCELLVPFGFVATQILVDTCTSENPNGVKARLTEAVKKNLPLHKAVYLVSMAALSAANPLYSAALGLRTKGGFISSGHVMVKTVSTAMLMKVLPRLNAKVGFALSAVNAVTDVVLMSNTVSNCHNLPEVAAGLGWGLGIHGISSAIASGVTSVAKRFFG